MLVLTFTKFQRLFNFFLNFCLDTVVIHLGVGLFSFHEFVSYLLLLLLLPSFKHGSWDTAVISILSYLLGFSLYLSIWSILEKFYMVQRRSYILLCLSKMLCKCLFGSFCLFCQLAPLSFCLLFVWMICL